jgi:hypothetical protein
MSAPRRKRRTATDRGQLGDRPGNGPVALCEVGVGEIVNPGWSDRQASSSKAARTRSFTTSSVPSS